MSEYLKLGIAENVRNPKFNYPLSYYGDIVATVSAGDTVCEMDNSSISEIENLVGTDIIRLGPSSHTRNPGVSEEVKISNISHSAGVYTFTVSDTIDYYYLDDDLVTGVSTVFPSGWDFTRNAATITDYPLCRLLDSEASSDGSTNYEYGLGGTDFYSLKIKMSGATTADTYQLFSQTLDDALLPSTYYRLGGIYKIKWLSGTEFSQIRFRLRDTSSNYVINYRCSRADDASQPITWTLINTTASKTLANPTTCYFDILHHRASGSLTDTEANCILYLDCFYVEFSSGTDDATDAVYTFTELPVLGSENFFYEDFEQSTEMKDGAMNYFNMTGRMSKLWTYSCRFEGTSSSFYRNLEILLAWQKEGRYLILHLTENPEDLLPSILIGKMELRGIKQNRYNLGLKDFTFIFKENI